MHHKSAFTLIETIISLIIITFILSIGLFTVHTFNNNKIKEEIFWKSFRNRLEFYEHLSLEHNSYTIIYIGSKHINFNNIYTKNKIINTLAIPNSLSINKSHTIVIGDNGYTNPQTIRWYSNTYHQTFKQIFQLGWGVYRVVPE